MSLITARANTQVKAIRALRNKRERERTGLFLSEGFRLVQEALNAQVRIETLVVVPERLRGSAEREAIEAARSRGARVLEVAADVYDSLTFREDPESMAAVVQRRHYQLPAKHTGELSWVAVHEIQHPGNLGTLIRTSDAAGGAGVILTGASTDPYHPIAVRGSLGAIFSQKVIETSQDEFEAWVRTYGARVIGTSPAGSVDYRDADYTAPVVILSGNERAGLSPRQLAMCDQTVRIPMLGRVDSLNLSIATSIVLYEAARSGGQLVSLGSDEPSPAR